MVLQIQSLIPEIRTHSLLDKICNLSVNKEVGHRFLLEQSIGHMGKQRSPNRNLN